MNLQYNVLCKLTFRIHCEAGAIIVEDTLSFVLKNRPTTKEIIKTNDDLEFLKKQTRHVEDAIWENPNTNLQYNESALKQS
jgi:hypothetical protein